MDATEVVDFDSALKSVTSAIKVVDDVGKALSGLFGGSSGPPPASQAELAALVAQRTRDLNARISAARQGLQQLRSFAPDKYYAMIDQALGLLAANGAPNTIDIIAKSGHLAIPGASAVIVQFENFMSGALGVIADIKKQLMQDGVGIGYEQQRYEQGQQGQSGQGQSGQGYAPGQQYPAPAKKEFPVALVAAGVGAVGLVGAAIYLKGRK